MHSSLLWWLITTQPLRCWIMQQGRWLTLFQRHVLFLKAAGINQIGSLTPTYYRLLEFKLFMWGEIWFAPGSAHFLFIPPFECSLWILRSLHRSGCWHLPLCRLYFRNEWKWQTLISPLTSSRQIIFPPGFPSSQTEVRQCLCVRFFFLHEELKARLEAWLSCKEDKDSVGRLLMDDT